MRAEFPYILPIPRAEPVTIGHRNRNTVVMREPVKEVQRFIDSTPTLENYWRAIILFGRNLASYKFALAKSLLEMKHARNDLIPVEELEVLTIHTRRALVGAALRIGIRQNVVPMDLVVQGVAAIAGVRLRFRV
jgi:hypothetical protein